MTVDKMDKKVSENWQVTKGTIRKVGTGVKGTTEKPKNCFSRWNGDNKGKYYTQNTDLCIYWIIEVFHKSKNT